MTISLPAPAEQPGADDEDVTRLILGWLMAQQSVHTRRAYAKDIDPALVPLADLAPKEQSRPAVLAPRIPRVPPWRQWCRMAGADPVTGVTRNHVNLYARAMEAAGLSPSTRARKLAAISSWYGWLAEEGRIEMNPAAHVKRPKVDRRTSMTPGLTKEQAVALLTAADRARGPQRLRWSALIATLLYSAARISEATGADIEDLGMSEGHRVLWVTRKGGERAALVLAPPVTERIDAYLASREDVDKLPALPGEPGMPKPRRVLFMADTGARLEEPNVWHLVRRFANEAGLPPELVSRIGPHALRHTAITFALKHAQLQDVQDMAGHSSADTTQRYNHARQRLDRSPAYAVAAYLASADEEVPT